MGFRFRRGAPAPAADPDRARLDHIHADTYRQQGPLERFAEGVFDSDLPGRRQQLRASIENERNFDRYGYGAFDDPEKIRRSKEILDALHQDESAPPEDTRSGYRKYAPLAMRAAGGVLPTLIGAASKIPGVGRFLGRAGIPAMLASGAIGESAATLSELATGDRNAAEETPRKTLARIGVAAGMNTITGGLFGKAALPGRLVGHTVSGAAQGAGSLAAEKILGEGELPDAHELGLATRGGALFGAALGGGGEAAVGAGRLAQRIRARRAGARPAPVERMPWERGGGDDVEFEPLEGQSLEAEFERLPSEGPPARAVALRRGMDPRFELEGARQPAMAFDEPVSPDEFGVPATDFESRAALDALRRRLGDLENTRLRDDALEGADAPVLQRRGRPFDPRFEDPQPGQLPILEDPNTIEAPGAEPPVRTAIERATSPIARRLAELEAEARTRRAVEAGAEPTDQRRGAPFDERFELETATPAELPLGEGRPVEEITTPGAEPLASDVRREAAEQTSAIRQMMERLMRRPPDAAAGPPTGEPRQSPLPGMLDEAANGPGFRLRDPELLTRPPAEAPAPAVEPPAPAEPARPFLDVGDDVMVGKQRGRVLAAPGRKGDPMVVEFTLEDGTTVQQQVNPTRAARVMPKTPAVDTPEAIVAQQEQAEAGARAGQLSQELSAQAETLRRGEAPARPAEGVITPRTDAPVSAARPRDPRDITKGELARRLRVTKLDAVKDPVTGGLNRKGFDQARERRAIGPAQQRVVMRADLDNFKAINDELGHDAGDKALKVVHDAIKARLRQGDLVSRVGGDEFAMDLHLGDPAKAPQIAEELEEAVREALEKAGFGTAKGRQVGISIGHGADEAAADTAAMVRKAERGVSKPREEMPAAVEWKPATKGTVKGWIDEVPPPADDVVDLGDISQDASPEAINAGLADAEIIAPRGANYTAEVLRQAETGTPGFAEEAGPNGSTRLVYRGPDGRPVGVATVSGKTIIDFAVDKTRGLLPGRAAKALGDALEARGVDAVEGGMTPDAKKFLDRIKAKKPARSADTPDTGPAALPAAIVDTPPKVLKDLSDADLDALAAQLDEVDDWMLHRGMSDEWKAQFEDAQDAIEGEQRARRPGQEAREDAEGLAAGTRVEIPASLRPKNRGYGLNAGDLGFEPNKKTGLRGAKNTIKLPGVEGEFVYSGGMSHGPYQEHQTNRVVPEAEWTGPKRTHEEQRQAWDAREGGAWMSRRRGQKKAEPDLTMPERGDDTGEVVTINGKRYVIAGEGPTLFSGKRPGPAEWDLEAMAEFEPRRAEPAPTIPTRPEGRYGKGKPGRLSGDFWGGAPYEVALEHARNMRGRDQQHLEELLQRQAKPKKADQSERQQGYIKEQIDEIRAGMAEDDEAFREAFGDDALEALRAPAAAAEPEPTTALGKKLKVKPKTLVQQAKANAGIEPKTAIGKLKAKMKQTEAEAEAEIRRQFDANPESRYAGENLADMLPQLAKEQRNRLSLVKQLEKELENPKLTAKKRKQAEADLAGIREEIEGTRSEMRDGWGDKGVKALDNAVVDHEPDVPASKGTYLPQRDPKAVIRERAQQAVGDFSSGRNKDLSTYNDGEIAEALKHIKASPEGRYPEFEVAAAKRLGMVDTEYPAPPPALDDKAIAKVTADMPVEEIQRIFDEDGAAKRAVERAVERTNRKMREAKAKAQEITAPAPKELPVNVEPERVEGEPLKSFQFVFRGTGRVRTYQGKTLSAAKQKFMKKFRMGDVEEVKEITSTERPAVTAAARMFRQKTATTTTTTSSQTPSVPAPKGEMPKTAIGRFKALMKGGVKRIVAEEGGGGWFDPEDVEHFRGLREELKADVEREVHNAQRFMDAGDFDTAQRILSSAYERRMRYFLDDETGAIDARTAWLMGRVAAGALYGSAQEPEDPLAGGLKYGAIAAAAGSSRARTLLGRMLKGGKATFGEALTDLTKPSRQTFQVRNPKNVKEDIGPAEHFQTPEEVVPDWFERVVPSMERFDDALRGKAGEQMLPEARRALRRKFLGRHANEMKAAAVAAREAGMPNRGTYLRLLAKQLLDEPTVLERFLSGATGHRISGQAIASEVTQHVYRLGTGANWAAGFINRVAQPYLGLVAMPLRYLRKGKAYVRTPQGRQLVDHLKLERPSDAPEGSYSSKLRRLDDVLQWPLRYGDIRNREDVFAGAYLFSRDSGRSHDASLRYAAETMRATQSMPGELGNPPMLRELGPLRAFTKYPIVWAELVSNVLQKPWDDAGKRRFLGAMLGTYVAGEMLGIDMKSILIPRFNVSAQAKKAVDDLVAHMTRTADHPLLEDATAALVPVQLRNAKEAIQEAANSRDGLLTKSDQRGVVRTRTMSEGVLNTLLGIRTTRQRRESEARTRFFERATGEERAATFASRQARQRAAAAYDAGDMDAVREALKGLPPQAIAHFYRTRGKDAVARRRMQLSPRLRQRLADLEAEVRAERAQP